MTRIPAAYRPALDHAPTGVNVGATVADTADTDDVVVFLIGMRINRWRKLRSWLPTAAAMPKMLRQLQADPELGLLDARLYLSGRDLISVQYWRSAGHLGRFAKDPSLAHAPAWTTFNRRVAGTADVGVWHETYVVPADQIETRYANIVPTGLSAALGVRNRAGEHRTRAHEQMQATDGTYVDA
jgi:hypothetical protein